MLLSIPYAVVVLTIVLLAAAVLNARERKLSRREKAVAWIWGAVSFEMLYLFALTGRVHSTGDLIFAAMLPLVTLGLGALTVYVLRD